MTSCPILNLGNRQSRMNTVADVFSSSYHANYRYRFPRDQKEAGIDRAEWEARIPRMVSPAAKFGQFLAGVMIGAGLLMVFV